tara:strand:- start:900 stop:1673 length:774 start_codon:yes stop_codon:yes gene_type:complete
MQTLAIIQARESSKRLPQKVLKPICGKPMLALQIERIKRCHTLDDIIVATSDDPSDQPIADLCEAIGVLCYRGQLDHVLDRMYKASKTYPTEHVIRLTGDCPLIDPIVIDHVVAQHLAQGSDYTCNTRPPTYPDGLDVEVIHADTLVYAWQHAKLLSEKEHVTPYIYHKMCNQIKMLNIEYEKDLSNLRWTVDHPEDFDFVNWVYQSLYADNKSFTMDDILKLCEAFPYHARFDAQRQRNEGYFQSLQYEVQKDEVL